MIGNNIVTRGRTARTAANVELAGPARRAQTAVSSPAANRPRRAIVAVERTTLIEFDSVDDAVAAYHSPTYQRALGALGDGAKREIRISGAVDDLDRDQCGEFA